jgi:hypothetical protein
MEKYKVKATSKLFFLSILYYVKSNWLRFEKYQYYLYVLVQRFKLKD